MKYKIYNQDIMEWAKSYSKGKFHALLCDPPYHLTTIVKRFGKNGSKPAQYGTDGVYSRSSAGFMGQTWDGGDVAFRPETWTALGEHLFPGAFGMAFSASRNWHRLAVAIEDAGFIIHPTIFGWLNGQGFPKATNISKQLPGNQVPTGKKHVRNVKPYDDENGWNANNTKGDFEYTTSDNPLAQAWEGHRYGLQALKPSVEPIIVFQKPYEGKPVDDIVSTGAGALNIDAGRIPTENPVTINRFTDGAKPWGDGAGHDYETEQTSRGRWPANFILDDITAPMLDKQTGTLTSGVPAGKKHAQNNVYGQYKNEDVDVTGFGDSGGASRFFYTVSNQIDESDPIFYCAKVSPKERNAGLDDLPTRLGGSLDGGNDTRRGQNKPQLHPTKNIHPTVKPIDLATYLAKLLLPPDEYAPRRILVPFSGVGSEMIGCAKAGWEQIVGIEFDTENGYIEIAEKRIEHWCR